MQKPKRKALNHCLYINHSDLQMERWSSWYVSCRDTTAWLFLCIDFRSHCNMGPIFILNMVQEGWSIYDVFVIAVLWFWLTIPHYKKNLMPKIYVLFQLLFIHRFLCGSVNVNVVNFVVCFIAWFCP